MGHQVIRQPDGLLAVWSTVVDDFVVLNATPEEIADHYAEEARRETRERWLEVCRRAQKTGRSGRMGWDEAQERRAEAHGRPIDLDEPEEERHG